MSQDYQINPLIAEDRIAVIDIFNYYIENSFAAYPENKVENEFFEMIVSITKGYPSATIKKDSGEVVGFGFLRPYHPLPAFKRTAEISYFIRPEYTGKGLGELILNYLLDEVKKTPVDSIIAGISSLNDPSIKFHLKHGFSECGRFLKVGRKNNTDFDIVWMQKHL